MGDKHHHERRYQFRRYQAKIFRNPYFRNSASRYQRPWKQYLIIVALIFVFGLFVYLIGFLPFWMIQGVRIEGLQFMSSGPVKLIATEQLNKHRFLFFPERNRIFFDSDELSKQIQKQYSFQSLEIKRQKKTLVITAKERVSEIMWQSNDNVYYVSMGGVIIRKLSEEERSYFIFRGSSQPIFENKLEMYGPYPILLYLNSLGLIVDISKEDVAPGSKVFEKGSIPGVIAFQALLPEVLGLSVVQNMIETKDSPWLRARTSEGFDILYDTNEDIASQIQNVKSVLQTEIKDKSSLSYIDVRFGNHVYYK